MANHIQRAYKLKLDGITVIGSTGEGCLTVFEADGVTPVVDLCELSTTVSTLSNNEGGGSGDDGGGDSGGFENLYSINFDGLDDYISTELVTNTFNFRNGFTASLWVYLDDNSTTQDFFGRFGDSVGRFYFGINGSNVRVAIGNSFDQSTVSHGMSTGQWHHVAYTFTGGSNGTFTYYLDGSSVGTLTFTWTSDSASWEPMHIGGLHNGSQNSQNPTNAQIDELSLFSVALSSSAISDIYNSGNPTDLSSESHLVAWWRMGDGTENGTGSTIYDMSDNSHDGTLENGATFSSNVPSSSGDDEGGDGGGGGGSTALSINSFNISGDGNRTVSDTARIDTLLTFSGVGTGYVYAVPSGSSSGPPSAASIKSHSLTSPHSSGLLEAGVSKLLIDYGLDVDSPYTIYSYVETGTASSTIGATDTFFSFRTYPSAYPLSVGYTGANTTSTYSIYWEPQVKSTGYFLPYISGTSNLGNDDHLNSPYVVVADTTPNVKYTVTFTGLDSNTSYFTSYLATHDAGIINSAGYTGIASSIVYTLGGGATTASTNDSLISNGLKARFFGWNDPSYVADSDYTTSVNILDGASASPASHDVVSSSVEYTAGKSLTGVFKNMTYNRTESIGQNGFAMTGLQFDGQNDFISLPQLQNNSKGLWDSEFTFLTENSADTSYPSGFSITYWIRPLWGVDHGPSSNQDYKPWSLGNSSAKSLGLYHKFDGSDRPAQLRGNSSNYMYSNSAANPPDPWDELYDTGNWTFMSVVYNGDELAPGYSADKFSDAFMISIGTGTPSNGDVFFFSGDGSSAGLSDDITIQGSNYAAYGSTSNSLIDLTQNYCATLGVQLKSDGSLANSDLAYWPGLLCDFRIYGRQISTGEAYSIFTGAGTR